MDAETDFLLAMLLTKKEKRRNRSRRLWVHHPLLLERPNRGLFYTLSDDLQGDDEKFFSYFRMSKNAFEELFSGTKHIVTKYIISNISK